MLFSLISIFKVARVSCFASPFPKYFAPLSPILLHQRNRSKEVRVVIFAIPSPTYFAPFSPILLLKLRYRFK